MRRARLLAVAILVITVLVLTYFYSTMETTEIATSMNTGPVCQGKSANINQSSPTTTRNRSIHEVLQLGFMQDFSSLQYNLTAVSQNDSFGFGPSYLLDGFSNEGYWYQIGIVWNWSIASVQGSYSPGFHVIYAVWAKNYAIIYPLLVSNGGHGPGLANLTNARNGDLILLSLTFARGNVSMSAYDWNSTSKFNASFDAFGATTLVGGPPSSPFPSNVEVEWYHVQTFFCSNVKVTFSNFNYPLSQGWMCIEEDNAGNSLANRTNIIFGGCFPGTLNYSSNPSLPRSFELGGTVVYSDAYEFVAM